MIKITERNTTIDMFKYVASLMVVAIHTTGTFGTASNLGFGMINVVCRIAVPFFAVSSGYFYFSKLENEKYDFDMLIKAQMKKVFILYLVWTIIYLIYSIPFWLFSGWLSVHAFVDYIVASFLVGSHYHLWYLLSLLYALPIFWIVVTFIKKKWLLPLSIMLWTVKVLSYGYIQFFGKKKWMFEWMDKFPAFRDAIILILPLLLLGGLLRDGKKNEMNKISILLIGSFFLLFLEAFVLKENGQTKVSFIFMTYPTVYFLMRFILNRGNIKRNKKMWMLLGRASIMVYCIHPIIGEILEKLITNNVICYLLTIVIATMFGVLPYTKRGTINNERVNI